MAVSSIGHGLEWLPVKTLLYVVTALSLNYTLTALGWAFVSRASLVATLFENVGVTAVIGTAAVSFSGGIIALLLQSPIYVVLGPIQLPLGYIMAPGLFGFVLAVRGNLADAQPHTLLKDQTLDLAAQALDALDRYTEPHPIRAADPPANLWPQPPLYDRKVQLSLTTRAL